MRLDGHFLPYQARWLADTSPMKIWEKSRRIGTTYCQAYEDVRDASRQRGSMDVWFSSADESAAKEYIRYCAMWARLLNVAAQDLGELVIDSDKDIKALVVEFATGRRIHGLSSNPTAFRSKGGKVVWDEAAWHRDQDAMWAAAEPVTTWGYPVCALSTHNGKGCWFYRTLDAAKRSGSESLWSVHSTPIGDAVDEGLADKILGRRMREEERRRWLEDKRRKVGDEDKWRQEYWCQPVDETTAWLPWDLIIACEHGDAGVPELYAGGPAYVGWDIARRRDLSIIWVGEHVGDTMWTREVVRLHRVPFAAQLDAFDQVMGSYRTVRACLDQTGMGEPIVEEAQRRHGRYRVEGVQFTGTAKQELAVHGKRLFEDRRVRTPADPAVREAHHAVRKVVTAAGNPRFDADRSEAGHADEFWSHMLALHAASTPVELFRYEAVRPRLSRDPVHRPVRATAGFGARRGVL